MIVTLDDLAAVRTRHMDRKLVLTSGTFDLFHVGHLTYLKHVKTYGDVLVVLLSSDRRIKARKGSTRPIISEHERAEILDALEIVDYVLIDPATHGPDEIDPVHADIVARLRPDMYVTDGLDIRFAKLLPPAKIAILPRSNVATSTTDIIQHIKNSA